MHMRLGKRVYWVLALAALFALAAATITLTSVFVSAGGSDVAQACDEQDKTSEAANEEADANDIEEQCDDENEADDADEQGQTGGVLNDGKDLLPQAGIGLDQAIVAAQSAASGPVGEVDLEYARGKLVFNVDIGDKDVKVDANSGSVVSVDTDD